MIMALRWQDSIEERKDVTLGKLVFKGTRLTVEHVLRELGTGMGLDDMLDNYPNLRAEHIQAAHLYAADVVAMDQAIFQEPRDGRQGNVCAVPFELHRPTVHGPGLDPADDPEHHGNERSRSG